MPPTGSFFPSSGYRSGHMRDSCREPHSTHISKNDGLCSVAHIGGTGSTLFQYKFDFPEFLFSIMEKIYNILDLPESWSENRISRDANWPITAFLFFSPVSTRPNRREPRGRKNIGQVYIPTLGWIYSHHDH